MVFGGIDLMDGICLFFSGCFDCSFVFCLMYLAFPFAATTIHRAIGYPSAATSAALLAASQYG
jgi:hypothetical protein